MPEPGFTQIRHWLHGFLLNRHFPDGPQIYCDDTLIAPPLE